MRVEDDRLVRGRGRFADDVVQRNQAIGLFVRAPVAHAEIVKLDVTVNPRTVADCPGSSRTSRFVV